MSEAKKVTGTNPSGFIVLPRHFGSRLRLGPKTRIYFFYLFFYSNNFQEKKRVILDGAASESKPERVSVLGVYLQSECENRRKPRGTRNA